MHTLILHTSGLRNAKKFWERLKIALWDETYFNSSVPEKNRKYHSQEHKYLRNLTAISIFSPVHNSELL